MTKVKVVDSIMGSGKTSATIELMNRDTENNYIFITPYLSEIERIKSSCANRKFYEPKVYSKKGETFYKIDSLHQLLTENKNIATTHALFKMATEETKELLYAGNYILILDEVIEVVKELNVSPADVKMLQNEKWIIVEDGFIKWNYEKEKEEGEYTGAFKTVKQLAKNNSLILFRDTMLIWEFPAEIFSLFKDVYILTYLFKAQIQKHYYDLNLIKYEKYIVEKVNDTYEFVEDNGHSDKEVKAKYKSLINIYEGDLNKIGDDKNALSKSWYQKKHMIPKLKNNTLNFFQHKMKSKSDMNMWTTYKDYKGKIQGKGYTKGFVSCTARATNEFSHKNCLAYTVNRFLHPIIKDYFDFYNIKVNQELYALSELIQWVWRSAVRNQEPINLYIPSKRMRELFIKWLDDEY